MPNKGVYKNNPLHRLVDHQVPSITISDAKNPQIDFLKQMPEFGWNEPCTPTRAGRKLNEFVDGQAKYNLLQDAAHLKRWVKEKVTAYIDGYLPTWLRRPKYVVDVIKLLRYIRRIVATVLFYKNVVNKEVALANHYIGQMNSLIGFAEGTVGSIRSEAESDVMKIWQQAREDNIRQAQENDRAAGCLL